LVPYPYSEKKRSIGSILKIYTRTGDKGETSLFGGKRVRKDSIRVEAYGAVDETNSCIGLARAAIHEGSSGSREALNYIDSVLEAVQNKLFAIGAALAGNQDPTYGVRENDVEFLESCIDRMDQEIPPLKSFILPFGTDLSTKLHLARTVSRRAERRIVELSSREEVDPKIIVYVNRLSDFLFTLARYANKAQSTPDMLWKKEGGAATIQQPTVLQPAAKSESASPNNHERQPEQRPINALAQGFPAQNSQQNHHNGRSSIKS
jgi:cob(I)alamin adenosyltransferase